MCGSKLASHVRRLNMAQWVPDSPDGSQKGPPTPGVQIRPRQHNLGTNESRSPVGEERPLQQVSGALQFTLNILHDLNVVETHPYNIPRVMLDV